jgi:hypothetical protein
MSYPTYEEGGICYLACEELFEFFNGSRYYCYRGCEFAVGRVNDQKERKVAESMCKRLTVETMDTPYDLNSVTDLRVHSFMFPTSPDIIYKACLAGIRRQRY